ncbi:conserved hypothetical protein [Leishmania major strain Friedlin]|uniref:Uncharacterized protein n=1 Tax=Leishmania major TaxID=5664 RepID=Q4QE00_LEIMA|nr:conserved hypothetical protein [Leishmania major strain Friedlin]CAG9572425.1 hypothetical_protein_-_conserved [Leishmania major strain Friedlin]CAJ03567.1 conserved hypothetical protein [Leishmania major strain Friedlin]|eukprot:XP_001682448.1 conserved hypothetical protein [Leishmania major strain Friedlin]
MQMQRSMHARLCHTASVNISASLSSPPCASASVLFMTARYFIQGGPPVPKKDVDKKRKRYLISPHTEEMEAKYQSRQRELHEYFATHEPNCPEPLPENSFVKGQFGMRRRYYVDHRGKIDPHALGNAVDEGTNAMRK